MTGDDGRERSGAGSALGRPLPRDLGATGPVGSLTPRSPDAIAAETELERARNWGRALDMLGEVVRTGGHLVRTEATIRRIEAEKSATGRRIEELRVRAAGELDQGRLAQSREGQQWRELKELIREDIPRLLDQFEGLDAAGKKDIVIQLLAKLPAGPR